MCLNSENLAPTSVGALDWHWSSWLGASLVGGPTIPTGSLTDMKMSTHDQHHAHSPKRISVESLLNPPDEAKQRLSSASSAYTVIPSSSYCSALHIPGNPPGLTSARNSQTNFHHHFMPPPHNSSAFSPQQTDQRQLDGYYVHRGFNTRFEPYTPSGSISWRASAPR